MPVVVALERSHGIANSEELGGMGWLFGDFDGTEDESTADGFTLFLS
jgi:hypothetical protein